jgi:hypothetical protein
MKDSGFLRLLALPVAIALALSLGCRGDNGLTLARVRGKVTYMGEPVKKGTVFFMPDDSKGTIGPPAVGSITSDGSYVMSTESSGDGVIVGSHKIGITGVDETPVDSSTPAPTPEEDSQGYMRAKAKGAAVARSRAARKKDETFTDRGGSKWRFVVPKKLTNPQESGIIANVEPGSQTMNFEIDESGQVRITK